MPDTAPCAAASADPNRQTHRTVAVSVAVPLRIPATSQPFVALVSVDLAEANGLLEEWGHYLGPVARPFPPTDAFVLDVDGEPLALATSDGIVGDTSAGYARAEAVELSRLCVRPGERWATRVMLRLWRERCGPKWSCCAPRSGQAPLAAVAYSKNDRHEGRIYRFDGWERVTTRAGSAGGGSWSRKRADSEAANGQKTLWIWRYAGSPKVASR